MAQVIYNGITTTHETALEVAARLGACCTFYYAEQRDKAAKAKRPFSGETVVWLVFSFQSNRWRLAEPNAWIDGDEDVTAYEIDGRKSEGETSRELLKLIEVGHAA